VNKCIFGARSGKALLPHTYLLMGFIHKLTHRVAIQTLQSARTISEKTVRFDVNIGEGSRNQTVLSTRFRSRFEQCKLLEPTYHRFRLHERRIFQQVPTIKPGTEVNQNPAINALELKQTIESVHPSDHTNAIRQANFSQSLAVKMKLSLRIQSLRLFLSFCDSFMYN
jgi:hypothetical protein